VFENSNAVVTWFARLRHVASPGAWQCNDALALRPLSGPVRLSTQISDVDAPVDYAKRAAAECDNGLDHAQAPVAM
jgi:hypothetical protein